jgi:hypothetical protein
MRPQLQLLTETDAATAFALPRFARPPNASQFIADARIWQDLDGIFRETGSGSARLRHGEWRLGVV